MAADKPRLQAKQNGFWEAGRMMLQTIANAFSNFPFHPNWEGRVHWDGSAKFLLLKRPEYEKVEESEKGGDWLIQTLKYEQSVFSNPHALLLFSKELVHRVALLEGQSGRQISEADLCNFIHLLSGASVHGTRVEWERTENETEALN